MPKILSNNKYGQNLSASYCRGVEYGYKQALNQFRLELTSNIEKSITSVNKHLKDAFEIKILDEALQIKTYNLDNSLPELKFGKVFKVELPTIHFRITIQPELPYFIYMEEEPKFE